MGADGMVEKKSVDYHIDLPAGVSRQQMMGLVERAAQSVGLYISHIGGYSRKKYPNSVHWHFKRDKHEPGIIDATFWDVKSLFWLMVQKRNAPWVPAMVPKLRRALEREVRALSA